jgi:hypothetical protein
MNKSINNKCNRIKKCDQIDVTGNTLIETEKFKNTRSKTFFLKKNNNFIDLLWFLKFASSVLTCKLKEICSLSSLKFNLFVDSVYENIITGEIRDVGFKTFSASVK